MSGICGIWQSGERERMIQTLATVKEGLKLTPEERTSQACDRYAGVAVSARFDTQRLYEDPNTLLAYEADLYALQELRSQVGIDEQLGTGALLAALYQRFGCDFVGRLRGGFSIVLWDRRDRKLIAAIDGFGISRLVYYSDSRVLLVGSRVDALLQSGEIDPEVKPAAIANLVNFSVNLGPDTIFRKIRRLAPGTMLVASEGEIRVTQYWDMRYGVGDDRNESRLARKLESIVQSAVADTCKEVEASQVGAFLSGGTDSSTVVGMLERVGKRPAQAFSIGFQEQSFNELGYAEIAARKFQAKHHTYLVGADDCFQALPEMVRFFDEPFGNSSAIPTYFCARLAAQNGVRILLAGDGGDELFGGNERYATDRIFEVYQVIPKLLRKGLIEPVLDRAPVGGGILRRARGYVRRANMPAVDRFISFQFLSVCPPADVFEEDFRSAMGRYSIGEVPNQYYVQAPAQDHLDRLLYLDVKITLGDSDLPKVTRMCELAGIRARFPFLDRSVAEFSGCIPARLKVKGFEKRYLFKKAFRELLPIEIIQKKKHGFGIPVATWLKTDARFRELAHDLLQSQRAFERGYFRRSFISELFRKHESDTSSYYGDILWSLLVLELWHRQVVDQPLRTSA